jgi:hypothetical protein
MTDLSSSDVPTSSRHTLLVLGSPGAGKSAFVTRLIKDKFSGSSSVASSAPAVEKQTDALIELQKKREEPIHIIEASGERDAFRANYKRWFVQSGAVLLLYDASNAVSFDFACKVVVNLLVEPHSGKARLPFALIGTQSDRGAAVSASVASEFAERHAACVHGVVSAKSDKRSALLALVRVLLEQLRPDRVNASMRVCIKKSDAIADTLARIGDNSTEEFTAVLLALRGTLQHRIDADKLIRDENSFNMLCSALGKQEALLDVYASKLDKSAGKLQRFVSNNKLRRKLEKLSSQLESVRSVIESTIASVLLVDDAPVSVSASGAPDTPAPPAPLQAPPSADASRARSPGPPARAAPEPEARGSFSASASAKAAPATLEKAVSTAGMALASATSMTMARLATLDGTAAVAEDQEARAFWSRAFGTAFQAPFDVFLREFGPLALADTADIEIKAADARVLRSVLDDAETDFVNLIKFAHFARGFAPLRGCLDRVVRLVTKPYFAGFLTSDDATRLLSHHAAGTFLVRFSKSRPGSFAIAYVDVGAADRVAHARLQGARGGGVVMNKTTFDSVEELVRVYQQQGVLTTGIADPIVREPWFRGDFDDAEATSCLQFTAPGTFLVRFDPQRKGFTFVVSYVAADRTIQHAPLRADEGGAFRAFSFGLVSDGSARSVRDIVDANAALLRTPAPRDDGYAEERALDPFAMFDEALGAKAAGAADDDDLRAVVNSVYQPLPGLAKPSPLAARAPPHVPARQLRTLSSESAAAQQEQQYAFISTATAAAPTAPKLRRGSHDRPPQPPSEDEQVYQVPAVLKAASSNNVERRSPRRSIEDSADYETLGEQRFDRYIDDRARQVINERKSDVPVLAPTSTRASTMSGGRTRVVHDGNVVLGDAGDAVVHLPALFVRECRDFRYSLTPIGRFAPIYVIEGDATASNTFRIAGGQAGLKVSWQVAGDKPTNLP